MDAFKTILAAVLTISATDPDQATLGFAIPFFVMENQSSVIFTIYIVEKSGSFINDGGDTRRYVDRHWGRRVVYGIEFKTDERFKKSFFWSCYRWGLSPWFSFIV